MQNKYKSKLAFIIIILLLVLGLVYLLSDNFKKSSDDIILNKILNDKTNRPIELAKKERNKLILQLDNGTEKIIFDIAGEGDTLPETTTTENKSGGTRVYIFDKLYQDINCYGVYVRYYVGMDNSSYYILINKNNGNEISLPSQNIAISPNKQKIVSYNLDLIPGFTTNGFNIVNIIEGNFYKEYESYPEDWGPSNAKWINDTELEFEKTKLNDNSDEEISGVVKFKLLNDEWIEVK